MSLYKSLIIILLFNLLLKNAISQTDYIKEIEKHRKEKDMYLSDSSKTPLKPKDLKEFTGLNYFPVDSTYRITATLIPYKKKKKKSLKTSSGNLREYTIYGELVFILSEKKINIHVYQTSNKEQLKKEPNRLFLPFTDNTSGEETYGGGRYIDFEITGNNMVIIDFNLAYNPYCAYTSGYSCAIPPKENHIDIAIKAGEKKYKEEH